MTGCNRRCPECIKPEFLSFQWEKRSLVSDVARTILDCQGITGITYSGGEPFEQAVALGELSKLLRASNLDVLSYTGYRLEALQRPPHDLARC